MLSRFSVKNVYTVFVGVVIVMVLGYISFANMTTDLLPSMDLPYVIISTSYAGASPEEVELVVTKPLESAVATVSDIKNITSVSSEHVSSVVLEFNDGVNMDSTLLDLNAKIDLVKPNWPSGVGVPIVLKLNPDMLPIMVASIDRQDTDIYQLSELVSDKLAPELEALSGVASVSASGLIAEQIDVTIEQSKIDVLNHIILLEVDKELAKVEDQLNEGEAQLLDAKRKLDREGKKGLKQIDAFIGQLEQGKAGLPDAIAGLETERQALQSQLDQLDAGIAQMQDALKQLPGEDVSMTPEQRAALDALRAQLDTLVAERDALEKELADLQRELDALGRAATPVPAGTAAPLAEPEATDTPEPTESAEPTESPDPDETPDPSESLEPTQTPDTPEPIEVSNPTDPAPEEPTEVGSHTAVPAAKQTEVSASPSPAPVQDPSPAIASEAAQSGTPSPSPTPDPTKEPSPGESPQDPSPSEDLAFSIMRAAFADGRTREEIEADIADVEARLAQAREDIAAIENNPQYRQLLLLEQALGARDELTTKLAEATAGRVQLAAGISQMDEMLLKLQSGILPGGMIEGMDEDVPLDSALDELQKQRAEAQKMMDKAAAQIAEAQRKLGEARKEFEEKRQEAFEDAKLDGVITLQMVSGILGAQNFQMPAGYVNEAGKQYLVRVGDKFHSLDAMRGMLLFTMDLDTLKEVRLGDVASVKITDNAQDTYAKVNGNDGVILSFQKQSTYSTAEVTGLIKQKFDDMQQKDPSLRITPLMDQGVYINIIVSSVLDNLIQGGLLAVLVLLIFLWDFRPTLIIAMSIPLSVVAAYALMYFTGITLNVMSLAGLALGVGMLVDNSIVVIDNIYRLQDEGVPLLKACVDGAKQMAGAITSSTLTTICVFLPILFLQGFTRDLFSDMGLTIAYSLMASLVVALTLVPAMSSALLKPKRRRERRGRRPRTPAKGNDPLWNPHSQAANGRLEEGPGAMPLAEREAAPRKKKPHRIYSAIQRGYVALLKGSLRAKWLVLGVSVALLVFSALQVSSMGTSFMPDVDSTQMTVELKLEDDTSFAEANALADRVMETLLGVQDVDTVGVYNTSGGGSRIIGSSGGGITGGGSASGDSVTFYVSLSEHKTLKNAEIARLIESAVAPLGVEVTVSTSNMDISMLSGSGITVNASGPELDTLRAITSDIADLMRQVPGVISVSDGQEKTVPELKLTVDKEAAIKEGLTVAQIYQFVAQTIADGQEVTKVTLENNKEYPVIAIDLENSELTRDDLPELTIEVTKGDETNKIRLGDVCEITETLSLSAINRASQQRTLSASCEVHADYNIGMVGAELQQLLDGYQPPAGYTVEVAGENEMINSMLGDLTYMVLLAILLIFLIMVAQFQSFLSPFIVLFTIPLAFTGGLLALKFANMDISIVGMLGFLMLSGVIVNNGIVFVDSINQMRVYEGKGKYEAIIETGRVRLRPILMTTLTTVLGMSTLALARGMGAEMMQPMAVVMVGGLSYATLMTLFVVPALYDLFGARRMKDRAREIDQGIQGIEEHVEREVGLTD